MITKDEIISVLIDYGLSNIEAHRVTDNKRNFELAIEDIIEKTYDTDIVQKPKINNLKIRNKMLNNTIKKVELNSEYWHTRQ